MPPSIADLEGAQAMVDAILTEKNCGPIFVRLAWHDSGTYDRSITADWPTPGGATGSIRLEPEILHGANAGLAGAIKLLEGVKESYETVSYADLFQMASARAIELAGGPKIIMKYGRVDATSSDHCQLEGNLPDAEAGENGKFGCTSGSSPTEDASAEWHLRKVFYKMGFNDEEIVALSGAHTFGRAHKDRSGLGAETTKFTNGCPVSRADGGVATNYRMAGSAWTKDWLIFDNSYFVNLFDDTTDPELLKLSTDKILTVDPGFAPYAKKFAQSQDEFFESYAKAHVKLSELGSKFEPSEGIQM